MAEALESLEQALQVNPRFAEALLRRGFLRVRLNLVPEALADWEQAFEHQPGLLALLDLPEWKDAIDYSLQQLAYRTSSRQSAEELTMLARACLLFGRLEQGLDVVLRAQELNPCLVDAVTVMRDIFLRLGTSDYAVATLQKLLKGHPSSPGLHYRLGLALHRSNANVQAMAELDKAIDLDPNHWEAMIAIGDLLSSQERHEAAYDRYIKALRLQPESFPALMGLARTCRSQYRFEEALGYCRKAAALYPQEPRVLSELGSVHLQLGQLEEGMEALRMSLGWNPFQVEVHLDLARAYQQCGETERAVDHYTQALKLEPKDELTAFNLGCLLRGLGRAAEAAQLFRSAQALNRGEPRYHYHLAQVLLEQGLVKEACSGLQAAVQQHPGHRDLTLTLGRAYLEGGAYGEAVEALSEVLEVDPQHAEALAMMGLAKFGLGEVELAEDDLRQALAYQPELPLALVGEGRILAFRGLLQEAVSQWLWALTGDPACRPAIAELARAAQSQAVRPQVVEGLGILMAENATDSRIPGPFLRLWLEFLGPVPDYELGALILEQVMIHHGHQEGVRWLHARWHLGWARRLRDGGDQAGSRASLEHLLAGQPMHAEALQMLEGLSRSPQPASQETVPKQPQAEKDAPPSGERAPTGEPMEPQPSRPEPLSRKRVSGGQFRRAGERLAELAAGPLAPEVAPWFLGLAQRLTERGCYAEAASLLARECLSRDPDDATARDALHEVLQRWLEQARTQGRPDLAASLALYQRELFPAQVDPISDLIQARLERVRREPENPGARQALQVALENDPSLALKLMKELAQDFPHLPEFALDLARLYVRAGSDNMAVHQYRRFLRVRPHLEAYQELAEAYTRLGKPELAATTLSKARRSS